MSNKFCDFTMQTQFIYIDSNRKCQNVQVLSLCKLSSFTLFSTELPLIFSARSRPSCQEVDVLKKYCFRFQPSSVTCHNFQVISLGKLSSFTSISTERPLIFSARSSPFWQEAEALKKYCLCFQPSDLGQGQFSQIGTLFLEKIGEHF